MIKIPQLHLKLYSNYSLKVKLKKSESCLLFFAAQSERNAESKQKADINMHL